THVILNYSQSSLLEATFLSTGGAVELKQLLATLQHSIYPDQREWAAEILAGVNWRANPLVLQALVNAELEDPVPAVRVACVRSLVKMKANAAFVVTAVQAMHGDADPRVRYEVNLALAKLLATQVRAQGPNLPQLRGTTPTRVN